MKDWPPDMWTYMNDQLVDMENNTKEQLRNMEKNTIHGAPEHTTHTIESVDTLSTEIQAIQEIKRRKKGDKLRRKIVDDRLDWDGHRVRLISSRQRRLKSKAAEGNLALDSTRIDEEQGPWTRKTRIHLWFVPRTLKHYRCLRMKVVRAYTQDPSSCTWNEPVRVNSQHQQRNEREKIHIVWNRIKVQFFRVTDECKYTRFSNEIRNGCICWCWVAVAFGSLSTFDSRL